MASYLTSATLIESVKRKENIPSAQATFQTDDFLAFANEEIMVGILPSIMQFHEEFLVYSTEMPLVNGQLKYDIPPRAVGAKIRTLYYKDTAGNLEEMARIAPEDIVLYSKWSAGKFYYLQNNSIVLIEGFGASAVGALVISYYLRPNQLVDESRTATILTIDRVLGIIGLNTVPENFIVNSAPSKLDLLETTGAHRTRMMDVLPITISPAGLTLSMNLTDIPAELQVGDYVALAGECIIPQIPDDLHVVLAQRVAARCLEALGDQNGLNAANTKLAEIEQRVGNIIDNRTEGAAQKIVNKSGFLRRFYR